MSQSDDIAEIVAFQVFQLTLGRLGEKLRMMGFGADTGKLAALCGATPQQVFAWERGELAPTTTQAVAWMRALRSAQARVSLPPAREFETSEVGRLAPGSPVPAAVRR